MKLQGNINFYRYEYSHTTDRLWRKNRNPNPSTFGFCPGVDLNRNFGYKWGHEVEFDKCHQHINDNMFIFSGKHF